MVRIATFAFSAVWRVVSEANGPFSAGPGPDKTGAELFVKSTDVLVLISALALIALGLVAVALIAPVALFLFAAAGAIGLNRQARRWRAADAI